MWSKRWQRSNYLKMFWIFRFLQRKISLFFVLAPYVFRVLLNYITFHRNWTFCIIIIFFLLALHSYQALYLLSLLVLFSIVCHILFLNFTRCSDRTPEFFCNFRDEIVKLVPDSVSVCSILFCVFFSLQNLIFEYSKV